jgi:hypothetical protein
MARSHDVKRNRQHRSLKDISEYGQVEATRKDVNLDERLPLAMKYQYACSRQGSRGIRVMLKEELTSTNGF